MTDPPPVNGRVTQRQLYDAIGDLRTEQRESFGEVKRDLHDLRDRVHEVENHQARECGEDAARVAMLREQRAIKAEQNTTRRWVVGLAVVSVISVALGIAGIVWA